MGTWDPGPQFSWSPAPHSHAFPSHSPLSQPSPWADVPAQRGLSLSLSPRRWPMPGAGLPPSCSAPRLGWWEICCPVVPLCFSAPRGPHSAESLCFPKRWANMSLFPAHLQTSGIFGRWVSGGTGWRFGVFSSHVFFQQGKLWFYAAPVVYLRLKWIHKNNFTN